MCRANAYNPSTKLYYKNTMAHYVNLQNVSETQRLLLFYLLLLCYHNILHYIIYIICFYFLLYI